MDSLNLLKQEINQTLEAEHDFAKWKLIVAAALGGTALGLDKSSNAHIWLLLLIPFTCAYIDLHLSQYQARILVLAQFIRSYQASGQGDDVDNTLPNYERYCKQLRSTEGHFFDLGQFANRLASFALSIAAPVIVFLAFWQSPCPNGTLRARTLCAVQAFFCWIPSLRHFWGTLVWSVGILSIWKVWSSHKHRLEGLEKGTFHVASQRLARMIQPLYSVTEIRQITSFLEQMGSLNFPALPNGLFPAAGFGEDKTKSGYSNIWVRDNIHIAHAHYVTGQTHIAVRTLSTLMQYFSKYRHRFTDIINGKADPSDPMNRPHIRFNGEALEEIEEKWAHAQNDALGYFLWMFCKLVNEDALHPSSADLTTLDLFPQYFQKIAYWQDEDSGHWEEIRKISASSIGTVLAGLKELEKMLGGSKVAYPNLQSTLEILKMLIGEGRQKLNSILPNECVQPDKTKRRAYDAALLFLIYPLQVVEDQQKLNKILANTSEHLQGEYGIRRYLGDSYWAPDYKTKLPEVERTVDFSDNLAVRDRLLPDQGQEAQWTLFDPVISCIYATRFRGTVRNEDISRQAEYLNRSLGQLTSETNPNFLPYRCPELYYLEHGQYVANDHVPLLWTQANLMVSLHLMEESCKQLAETPGFPFKRVG